MDHSALLAVALAFLAFGLWSRWLERWPITGPILFTAFGLLVGPPVLGLITIQPGNEALHFFAEVTLVLVLFSDAAKIDAGTLWREHVWPRRLLVVGLPLGILVGTMAARGLFPDLGWWAAALLAAMLSATDAALGRAVVEDERIPQRVRTALNVESGLNDGIALPFVLFFAAMAGASSVAGSAAGLAVGDGHWLRLAALQVILGPLAGAAVGVGGGWLVGLADRRGWMGQKAEGIVALALPLAAFALAELVHGNGFLAAFAAGLSFRATLGRRCEFLFRFEEVEARILVLLTFTAFGCVLLPAAWPAIGWRHALFAILMLTVVRIGVVSLSLLGAGASVRTCLFLGWFGPRGLASLLFVLLILLQAEVAHAATLFAAVVTTVLLSVVLHGVSAAPLARWYGRETVDRKRE